MTAITSASVPTASLLTTIFTPPPECSNRLFSYSKPDKNWDGATWDPDWLITDTKTISCSPSNYFASVETPAAYTRNTRILGVCPADYTTIGKRFISSFAQYDSSDSTSHPATQIFCCPS
jgi:hypothetical protein